MLNSPSILRTTSIAGRRARHHRHGLCLRRAGEGTLAISLAEWSLHRALFKKEITTSTSHGWPRNQYGVTGLEYVNQFFKDKAKDTAYLADLKSRAEGSG